MSSSNPIRYLITGAAQGIGRGLSRTLILQGSDVFLIDRNQSELEHTLQTHIPKAIQEYSKKFGLDGKGKVGRWGGMVCDVGDEVGVKNVVKEAARWHRGGKFDVLINNAANTTGYLWSKGQTMETVPLSEWEASLRTNLTGSFLVSQASIPFLKRSPPSVNPVSSLEHSLQRDDIDNEDSGSCIIHMSSTRALQSEPNAEGYASTKAGLLGLTHSMACSLAPLHIRVNAILPGWMDVIHESKQGDEEGKKWGETISRQEHQDHWVGRVGKVEDVAKAVRYFATAGFVTGETTRLDGGKTRQMIYPE